MNQELQDYARGWLKERLPDLPEDQQHRFKQMYSHNNLDMPINEVVENMEADRLSWAMEQIKRTIEINAKRKGEKA